MSELALKAVSLALGDRVLLDVDAIVRPQAALSIMGPSGSGKSSLLAFIGGFLDPAFKARGHVVLDGRDITNLAPSNRRTGILFQDPLLFPHMSVGENLLFAIPPETRGRDRKNAAEDALARAGLPDFFNRDPATLSGGQKARVALMRVLLSQPAALLLDEPFSSLDAGRREAIRKLVFEEANRQGLPTVLVTHDEADAAAAGGEIIHLRE